MKPKNDPAEEILQAPEGVTLDFAHAGNLEAPEAKILYAYWVSKRGDRLAPCRDDIEPKDIRTILPNIHLYDVEDEGRSFRVRIVGTRIVAAIGTDPTGTALTTNETELMYARAYAFLTTTHRHRRPVHSATDRTAARNVNYLAAENLTLPLSDDGATINKIMICTIFKTPRNLL